MRPLVASTALTLIAALLASCSGGDDRPSLIDEAPPVLDEASSEPTPEAATPTPVAPELQTGAFVPVGAVVVQDGFAQSGAIGQVASLIPWQPVVGGWEVDRGQLRASDAVRSSPSIVVASLDSAEGFISVSMPRVVNGSGLVFRFVDSANHWKLLAAPGFATWGIYKVVNGTETLVTDVGLAATRGFVGVAIMLDGERIQVFVNGVLTESLRDSELADATAFGLIDSSRAGLGARFDDVTAVAFASVTGSPAIPTFGPASSGG
jgi:hypothetical protein